MKSSVAGYFSSVAEHVPFNWHELLVVDAETKPLPVKLLHDGVKQEGPVGNSRMEYDPTSKELQELRESLQAFGWIDQQAAIVYIPPPDRRKGEQALPIPVDGLQRALIGYSIDPTMTAYVKEVKVAESLEAIKSHAGKYTGYNLSLPAVLMYLDDF